MLFGHVAVPTLLRHYLNIDAAPLYVGSVFPDVMDKGLYVGGMAENGRSAAHTLVGLGVSTLFVRLLGGRTRARAWALGYFGHLVCDAGGDVPWLYPFKTYAFRVNSESFWQKLMRGAVQVGLLEMGLVAWALWVVLRNRRTGAHAYS